MGATMEMEFDHADECARSRDCDETPDGKACLTHGEEGCPHCDCSIVALFEARARITELEEERFTEAEAMLAMNRFCERIKGSYDYLPDEQLADYAKDELERIRKARPGDRATQKALEGA